jgi:predicted dehydrogenase
MTGMTRRQFLAGSAAAVGAFAISTSTRRVLGAGDDIRVAVVGFHGKGGSHISAFSKMGGVRLVALCDCDMDVLNKGVADCDKKGLKVTPYQDIRKLLEDKNVDAIATATPNHWHSLATVWACQAGKDVYVEKPLSHEIWEGRKATEAARKYKRIVQVGTQSRSDGAIREAYKFIQGGGMGKILLARGFCYKPRGNIGKVTEPTPIPPSIDYDLWCGPAPKKPLMRKRLHYDWHWFWDTGNADIGNQGIHQVDLCRWGLGQNQASPRVMGIGGRFVHDDDAETPNTEIAFIDFKPAPMIFEVRGLPRKAGDGAMDAYSKAGIRIGVVIECENGYLAGGFAYDKNWEKVQQFKGDGGGGHQANFIKAVRSRKVEDLNADVLEGHFSACLFHEANASYRVGKAMAPEQALEIVKGDKNQADCFGRFMEHIKANEADLKKTPVIVGPWLDFDTQKEVFTGALAAEANKYVKRDYRKPFEIPEQV